MIILTLIYTIILIGIIAACYYSIVQRVESWGKAIMDRLADLQIILYDEGQENWQAIMSLKSDTGYLPKRSEKEEKPLDPRDQKHLPYVNPAWDDHPLYSIAKSLHSLDKYFTHNKE